MRSPLGDTLDETLPLSTFLLLLETDSTELKKREANQLFFKKSILLGIKGSFQCAVVVKSNNNLYYPAEVEKLVQWLLLPSKSVP